MENNCDILNKTVFQIKVLFCAPAGCKDHKMVQPAICSCVDHHINLFIF